MNIYHITKYVSQIKSNNVLLTTTSESLSVRPDAEKFVNTKSEDSELD